MTYLRRTIVPLILLAFSLGPNTLRAQDKDQKDFEKDLIERAKLEYAALFKAPEKTHEFWAAMNFEISVGKFELAGYFLREMVNKEPKDDVDKELVKIQQALGTKPFYELRDVREWSKNKEFEAECRVKSEELIKRVLRAVDKHLSDPERIKKAIVLLESKMKEERDTGFIQLQRSRTKALPYMLDVLRTEAGKTIHRKMIDTFILIHPDFIPPLLEILKAVDDDDFKETSLRLAVIEIFRKRGDRSCVPYLWHLSVSTKYPLEVRQAARSALAYFRDEDPARLPSAKYILSQMADKCFQHKLKVEKGGYRIWLWDGRTVAAAPKAMDRREAEEFFGLRYAREALELDPAYKPAQTVLLNFYLERTFDRDLDKYFFKPMSAEIQQLLLSMDTDFLMSILNRAYNENNVPIILPLVEILGTRAEIRFAQPSLGTLPRGLTRALYHPDLRVQFAAVNVMTRMPYKNAPADSVRVVDVLRRFLASEPVSRTMVAMVPKGDVLKTEKIFQAAGFDHLEVRCSTLDATFEKLRRSADYDVIFIHPKIPLRELPYVLGQLRGDVDQARIPVIVLSHPDNLAKWRKVLESYPNTWVELDTLMLNPAALKKLAAEKINATSPGYNPEVGGFRISAEERKKFAEESMKILVNIGRGEIAGYDVRHAQDTVRATLHKPELASMALEVAARNPDRDTQIWLGNVFFDPAFAKLKLQAITALRLHIQKNGLSLEKHQVANLIDALKSRDTPPEVRTQLTLVLNGLRLSPAATGKKLSDFNPPR